jgi:alginate O-acetyltransferase complex protein AlgI
MLFNSQQYLLFFGVVFCLYYASPHRWRRLLLLAASAYFYTAWIPQYILLIVFSTLWDFSLAKRIHRSHAPAKRKALLVLSCAGNLGILALFKYADFILANISWLAGLSGVKITQTPLGILLPIGISFYTFQTLSYSIDVYRGRLKPVDSILDFAVFVCFFPQLIAGPILRADELIPQLRKRVAFIPSEVKAGLLLALWGMSKKMLFADVVAPFVDRVYAEPHLYSAATLLNASYAYALQIYCDFSGYTDIALGCARMLGFKLIPNFDAPYLACSITDFWRRWHMSLSRWLRDYLYISLGGNRISPWRTRINLMLTMLLGGLWHGASWNFVIWGGLHGLYLSLHKIWTNAGMHKRSENLLGGWIYRIVATMATFHLVLLSWIFFRAQTLAGASDIITRIACWSGGISLSCFIPLCLLFLLLIIELLQRKIAFIPLIVRCPRTSRFAIYFMLLFLWFALGVVRTQQFIYFQF